MPAGGGVHGPLEWAMSLGPLSSTLELGVLPAHHWQAGLTLLACMAEDARLPAQIFGAHLSGYPERVVGAAAFIPRQFAPNDHAFLAWVQVLPAWRRQGVGRALIHRLRQEAAAWSVDALQSLAPVEEPDAIAAMHALACHPGHAMHHYIADTAVAWPLMHAGIERLYRRKRVPPSETVLPLAEVPSAQVIALHASYFGQSETASRRVVHRALHESPGNSLSFAVWDGERVSGALIAGGHPAQPEVKFWFSAPACQDGRIALLTLHAFVEGVGRQGLAQGRFICNERTRATMNIARKFGARLERVTHHWRLPVCPPCEAGRETHHAH